MTAIPTHALHRRLARLALFCLALAASSCGGCKDGDGGRPGDYETPKGPFGDVLQTLCDTLERCPNAFGSPIAYRSNRECVAILNFVTTCRVTETELGDDVEVYGVEQRTPTVNAEAADECMAWIRDASCGEISRGTENGPCDGVFSFDEDDDDTPVGSAGLNEPCDSEEDCQAELYCAGETADEDAGISYCSVCKPRLQSGESCQNAQCAEGLYCKLGDDMTTLTCTPAEADGFRCSGDVQCASGWCNYNLDEGGGWGQCDPGGKIGDPCQEEADQGPTCREGLHCDGGKCQVRRGPGEPCSDSYACEYGNCDVAAGVCGKAAGESCYDSYECAGVPCINDVCSDQDGACTDDSHCADDEICNGACRPPNCSCSGGGCPVGTCGPAGAGGGGEVETCEDDFDCVGGDCQNGVCVGKKIGDACSETYECYPYQCLNNRCAAKNGPGDECGAIDSCQEPFLCIDGRCEMMNLVCQPASAGQRCAWLRVCDDNSWCDLLDDVTCKPKALLGQECQTTYLRGVETCQQGSTCEYDEASQKQICKKLPGLGEACTAKCANGFCWEGKCEPPPIGQPCDQYNEDIPPCPGELRCDGDREVCLPRANQGSECDDTSDCAQGLFCENYRTCEPRRSAGAECNDDQECLEELHCSRDTYTCVADLRLGESCDTSNDYCAPGFYCDSDMRTCQRQGAGGAECSDNRACQSGVCYGSSFCLVRAACEIPE